MINKITTLLIIIIVNTNAIAQQAEYKLGEQFLDFALQDYKLGKFQSAINNTFTSNKYFSKIGSDGDTIIAFNNYLIGRCHKELKSDSSVFYFEKVYRVIGESNYKKDMLIANNFIEKYLAEYYFENNIRNSIYYYKKLLQTSQKLYGATNFQSLWSASVLSQYYNSNNAFNDDSVLYYADYLISNDSCYYMSLKTDIFITKIEAHLYFGDKSLVPGIVNEYLMILEKYDRDNQLKKIQAYSLLSLAFQGLNDSKMALEALIQEKVILEKYFSSNDSLLAQCYTELGAIYANLFNHKESKIYFDKAKSSFARINNELNEDYLKYLNNLSGYFQSVSELDSSIYFAKLRVSLLSKTGNKERVFKGLTHIASLYDQNYQYDKSDEIYSNLYSEIKQGSTIDNNIFYKNYLKHMLDIGKIDKAKILFDELKKEIDLNQVTYWQILFLHDGNELMAEYYQTKGKKDSTLYYYQKAKEICKKFKSNYDNYYYCASTNTKIGSYYFDLGEYTNAIEVFNENINIYGKNFDLNILSTDYLLLSTSYFNNGQIDSALTILEKIGNKRLDNQEIAINYFMQKSQIYNLKYNNLTSSLLYLDSAYTIMKKDPQKYILQYVNYLNSYCYLYIQYNQGFMAITKLLEGIESIQKLKGDSSIVVYKIMNNNILETTKLNDNILLKRVKDAIKLKNALMVKYNIKNEGIEMEEMLTKISILQPKDAIFCCHNFIDKKKLVSLLGYEKGLVYYNQILSANHAHLNNMDSALYYANLNLDIVRKGLVNTYNTKYIATIGVLKCYYFLRDYANFFEINRLYKEMNLDTLDLEYLHQTRLAFSSINSESGFDISDLMMQLKENSLNEKLFFIPFNQRAELLFGFRRDFNNHEAILYRLRDKLNLKIAYNSILRSENILFNTELISRSAEKSLSNNVLFNSVISRKEHLQDSINKISNINLEYDSIISQEIFRLKKEQYENQRLIFELIGDTLTSNRKSNINFQSLQSSLNNNDIVVHYRYIYSSENSDSSLYYAFIYDKQSAQPQIVGSFKKGQLDKVLSKESNDDIYSNDALYNLILKPYENLIKEKHTRLIIIPDEELFNVSFNAIRMANDSFLIEKKEIAVLSSINDLMDNNNSVFRISSNTNVLIYGGINYQEKDTSVAASIKKSEKDNEPYFVLNRNSKFKLNYLPGTLEEIANISKVLSTDNVKYQIVKGNDAKEENFYEYIIDKSPAILHFATHGYFLGDSVKTIESEDININKSLMQNGIFLSNSQKTWDKGIIGYDKSDGIINGLEIASTNLSNTELVVLSACNSGRGRIINREGVYGLQKGFKLAGAKSILYTLWPIPDKETVDFITKYYKHLLEEKNASLAYRKTVLELLLLDQYRATPNIWAGFVLVN